MSKEWYEGLEIGRFRGYLKDLVADLKAGKHQVKPNPLSCIVGCTLTGVIDVLSCVEGIITVVHGPIGCAYIQGTMVKIRWSDTTVGGMKRMAGFVSTNITEKDLIMGAEDKLEEAILRVDREFNPQIIAVLTTCSSGIIGEDIEGVVDEIRPRVKAKLLPIHSPGFSCRHQGRGYDIGYSLLINEIMEEPSEKIPLSINIIGDKRARSGTRLTVYEINRVLERIGIRLNKSFIVTDSTIEDVKAIPKACYNALYCVNSGYHPAKHLEEKFGIPFNKVPLPTGLEASRNWYLDLCDFFNLGKRNRDIIEIEYEEAKRKIQEPMKILRGKKIGIGQNVHRLSLARYASQLGMEVVYMGPYYARELGVNEFARLVEEDNINPYILVEPTYGEEEAVINWLKPDLFLNEPSTSLWAFNAGAEFEGVEHHPQMGFAGAVHLAQRWAKLITKRPYSRIRNWVELPPHSSREFIETFPLEILDRITA